MPYVSIFRYIEDDSLSQSQLLLSWEWIGQEYKRWQEMKVVIIGSHARGIRLQLGVERVKVKLSYK